MSLHFFPAKVKEIRKETNDCISIALQISDDIKKHFEYQHGQYITVRAFINNEEVRRSYSLCSSPLDNEWRIAVKRIAEGVFSSYAEEQLKIGDELEIMPPMGKFNTILHSEHKKSYIGFAAGSGITPVLSIIKTTLRTEPESSFTLIYGNKTKGSIIFKEELEALKNKYINRFRVIHILSRERTDADINYGRIDRDKCVVLFSKLIDLNADEFFICGPEGMIFTVKDFLTDKGIEKNKIHFELFTSPNQNKAKKQIQQTKQSTGPVSKITVRLDGRSFDFDLPYDSNNILDAALHQGADLPYACKGGVCCTCRAKLIEGEVEMEANYGLEPEEVAQGFILTCQSHPKTEKVVVDFDSK